MWGNNPKSHELWTFFSALPGVYRCGFCPVRWAKFNFFIFLSPTQSCPLSSVPARGIFPDSCHTGSQIQLFTYLWGATWLLSSHVWFAKYLKLKDFCVTRTWSASHRISLFLNVVFISLRKLLIKMHLLYGIPIRKIRLFRYWPAACVLTNSYLVYYLQRSYQNLPITDFGIRKF